MDCASKQFTLIELVFSCLLAGSTACATRKSGKIMTSQVLPCHVIDFWPEVRNDLTRVTWSHATNSKRKLTRAIRDHAIMMIEADVVQGRVFGSTIVQPIMAHPPQEESDLSLDEFMVILTEAINDGRARKGVKLDFKDLAIVEESMEILESLGSKLDFPVWFNADILEGPGSSKSPLSAEGFIGICQSYFPDFTLSLGWTTGFSSEKPFKYTMEHVQEMLQTIKDTHIDKKRWITFPVRAALAVESTSKLEYLLEQAGTNSTLTLWTAKDEPIDQGELQSLRRKIGPKRLYEDLIM